MGFPIGAVRMVECNSRSSGGDSGTRFRFPVIALAERDSRYERSGQRDETPAKRTNPW